MAYSFTDKKRIRKNFASIHSVATLPSLLEIQQNSFESFLNSTAVDGSKSTSGHGLHETFQSVFPIQDNAGIAELDYVSYELGAPKFDVEECMQRDMTFSAPLRATLRLTIWETDEDTGARAVKDIKEQEIYLSDVPMMTEHGSFVINGTERVVVSQMHRSPGVFFDHDNGATHSSGKLLFSARVIPFRGSWLDFEFDHKDNLYVRIDRRRKLPATYMFRAMGMEVDDIINAFYDKLKVRFKSGKAAMEFTPVFYEGVKLASDLIDADSGEKLAEAGKKLTKRALKKIEDAGTKWIAQKDEELVGRFLGEPLINKDTGEVMHEAGVEITEEILAVIKAMKLKEVSILKIDFLNVGPYIRNTLQIDKASNREEALSEIYKVMRPGEPPTLEASERLFNAMFFDEDRYDLSNVGRMKMNARLGFDEDDSLRVLVHDDILAIVKKLVDIRDGNDVVDDIDHLGNRRVRSVGELMENQFRIGLLRMERGIKERMANSEVASQMPQDLVNARPLGAAMREFFSSSQLSQFMDQTNPLSEVTHKRRLSALGPGGLTRERAGFEVRDVHTSHYGRICPIETPEGPNIGLINSLSTYARVNKYGFIETPYRKIVNGKAVDEVVYMSAITERNHTIAQASAKMNAKNELVEELVTCRRNGETMLAPKEQVDFIDVAPQQVISIATALIPFLENDDANRALMGANMMRQAVPLVKNEAPLVGTGVEGVIAADSGVNIVTRRAGVVESVDGSRIVVRVNEELKPGESGVDVYRLRKFRRSNQNSCLNQRVIARKGDVVGRGDIIADGPSTELGELALGRNVTVAFMPWNGYNFEDSILISEKIVRDDVYTSIHIDEFDVMARDTKLGSEEITRDIPNVGEEALKNLDESGIVRIGAQVRAGSILVGKITPKGETPMTPEEKLLRAIFGEKAADVRDTSLRMSAGVEGTVVGVKVFNRRGAEKDSRTVEIEENEIAKLTADIQDERRILEADTFSRLKDMIVGQKAAAKVGNIAKGAEITADILETMKPTEWWDITVGNDDLMKNIESLKIQLESSVKALSDRREEKIEKIRAADELAPGVLKMVKVFVAVKRKLQPGDKMAGRHGNKGVISRILPVEDMPYQENGEPVDIVLNPLGVPSRMNVGQILETHLGWACKGIGRKIGDMLEEVKAGEKDVKELRSYIEEIYKDGTDEKELKSMKDDEILELSSNLKHGVPIATPAFDGASNEDINKELERAGVDTSGQIQLYDGLTGEAFDRKTTVGIIYMLKLHHLVDEKIHARSIGPYSLVTQQPLGGKAQFGGQRFGEMEVWALQAYGASYILQEMLTVKSDDVSGRTKTYEAIVRGEDNFEAGVPESFNVLTKEIAALGLNIELVQDDVETLAGDDENSEVAESFLPNFASL